MEVMKMFRSYPKTGYRIAKITGSVLKAAMDELGVTEAAITKATSLPSGILPVMITPSEAGWYVYIWVSDGDVYWFSEADVYGMPLSYRKESS